MRHFKVLVVATIVVVSAFAGTASAAETHRAPWGYSGGFVRPSHPMPLAPTPQSAPVGAHASYLGGPVVSHASIESVFWGSGPYESGVGPGAPLDPCPVTTACTMAEFFQGLTDSVHMDWLSEYDTTNQLRLYDLPPQSIGRGGYQGQVTITPSTSSTTIDDDNFEIADELVRQIDAGALPPPQLDSNGQVQTVYAVFLPETITVKAVGATGGEPGGFCAYHTTSLWNGVPLPYMVLPDFESHQFAAGCGDDPVLFNNFTAVAAHEVIETITDPMVGLVDSTTRQQVLSWIDIVTGEEIADICEPQHGTVLGGNGLTHVVALEFSDVANDCVVSRSVPTPPRHGYVNACTLASRTGFADAGYAADCLKQYGIALGKNDGTFGESDGLVRSQVSSLLARLIEASGVTLGQSRSFADVAPLANTQVRQEIEELAGAGIIAGTPDGLFHPNDQLSVAQAATLVNRTLAFLHAPNAVDSGSTAANYLTAVNTGVLDLNASDIRGFSYSSGTSDVTARGLLADMLAESLQRLVDNNIVSRA